MVRSPGAHSGPSVSALPANILGREEPYGADPNACVPAALLTPPVSSVKGGMGTISARLAKSLGWPSAGEGQAGTRRPDCPQFLPQVPVPLAAGKGELISELHPKQRRPLEPAEGSSASWGSVLHSSAPGLFINLGKAAQATIYDLSLPQGGLTGISAGKEQGSQHLVRL